MYKIFNETLRSNSPVVGHLAYRIDTKTRHVRRKMASAFFLSPKISAFHDTRRCRTHVNRLIVNLTSLGGRGAVAGEFGVVGKIRKKFHRIPGRRLARNHTKLAVEIFLKKLIPNGSRDGLI